MTLKQSLKKAVAAATAALGVAGLAAVVSSPAAGANPHGGSRLVTIGDSFTSNPTIPGHPISGSDPLDEHRQTVPSRKPGCIVDPFNWPRVAAQDLGLNFNDLRDFADYSCNGTGRVPVQDLTASVDAAINQGDIGPSTNKVVFMYGGLDALTWVDAGAGMLRLDIPTGYDRLLVDMANRVRQHAPHAEVVFAGYPELTSGDTVCLVNLDPNAPGRLLVPGATAVEDSLRNTMRSAAAQAGARFVDLREATRGHGTCAAPDQRYVAGLVDTTVEHNMRLHPTIHGQQAIGHYMAGQLHGA
ncbi:GDSL-type esterase/lipase family protein [Corynebacterium sp. 335C]